MSRWDRSVAQSDGAYPDAFGPRGLAALLSAAADDRVRSASKPFDADGLTLRAGDPSAGALFAPLPTVTNAQIASYLETGFWSWFTGGPRAYNIDATGTGANSGVLSYNVAGLTAAGAALADEAFELYEEVLGIDFVKTTSNATTVDFFFSDDGAGLVAEASSVKHPGTNVTDFSNVAISTGWLDAFGSTIGSYGFQTYLHEIGHALGLGHAGAYNGSASFVTRTEDQGANSNVFLNDSWQASMMSYFSQTENTVVEASFAYLISPMAADWIALANIYGGNAGAFAGNTIWGFNTNIVTTLFADLASYADDTAFTIIDGGGTDTLDFSGFVAPQVINLDPERTSNIGGLIGNMVIARGTVIENANGGSGRDIINGTAAINSLNGFSGNDTVDGFAGNDLLIGGKGNDTLRGGENADTLRGVDGNDNLTGGPQADILIGGLGNDIFDFNAESASNAAQRDTCRAGDGATAFQGAGAATGDRFDLVDIDANTGSGNQAFVLGGDTGQGRLWAVNVGTDSYIRGNSDADAAVEFEFRIEDGAVLASAYTAADFFL